MHVKKKKNKGSLATFEVRRVFSDDFFYDVYVQ